MTTIASMRADTPLSHLHGATSATAAVAKPSPERAGGAIGPAAIVTLSDAARAMLHRAEAGRQAAAAVTPTFEERVQARTGALADRLNRAFAAEGIPADAEIALRLDTAGRVGTDSPYRKTIEKIFENDPDLAKEFRDVAALNGMRAAQKALDLYAAEKQAARDDDERGAALDRYTARSMTLQKLSGAMTLKDGKLASAALDYVQSLSGPQVAQAETKPSPARADDADILQRYRGIPSVETWAAQARADNVGLIRSGLGDPDNWVGIARRLNAGEQVRIRADGSMPSDDAAFQDAVNLGLGRKIAELEDAGRMDQAASLRTAMGSGTLEIRTSSDVPDLDLRYTTMHFADAGGGGTRSDWNWNPTGAAKAALDGGRAMVFGGVNRGAFYVSW